METIEIKVNGETHTITADPNTPLLYVLRNELELNGPKFGCGLQQCGACMVLIGSQAQPSCMLPVSAVSGKDIRTLEGLVSKNGDLHKVQQAFIDEQAAQCGYCMNGMIMQGVSISEQEPEADERRIRERLQINICRCGTHCRILKAIKKSIAP
ncbi:(2Fe-2S)-binding protein [Robertkochia solimangrovi]|uniref:(2Fe-2S)-binding protein n=1 Tax=Robertkochia solimangrovi TaxID=2213046 RepID=UPI00117C5854|nr:(2Fe-2S)-binding protein [Robertkochia solimangrovi]TRZ46100.1 (2Fe-2S)-binding protein [Robertkochia solimangrovi]